MKPRLTTIALATIAISGGALAQIEPLTCHGPGATHDCLTTLQPLDALAAASPTQHDPIRTAELLLERGDTPAAHVELMGAITTAPSEQRAELYFLLGVTESRLGNHLAATHAFGSVHPATFASRYNQAITRAKADDLSGAQLVLERLLADTLKARHDITNLQELSEAEELEPSTLEAVTLILTTAATFHYMNETPLNAVNTLEQLLKVAPRTPELTWLEATALLDLLPGDGAVLYAQRSLKEGTRDLFLGRAYAKAQMHDYAQQHYYAAAQQAIKTSDAAALTEIAGFYATNDQWEQAGHAATEALRFDPTNHQARTLHALALENQGNPTEAAAAYRTALQRGADPISTNTRLAMTLATINDHAGAMAAAEAALYAADAHPMTSSGAADMSPEGVYALLALLANSHYALGELPEALAYADAATTNPHSTPDMSQFAGDLAMTQGDPTAALTHYANADQSDPNVARATYHAHLQLEQYPAARDAAQALNSQAGEALHLIAWTYALQGDMRAAHQAWQRAAQTDYAPAQQILERIN